MSQFPRVRPRRLRATPALRRLTAETRLHPADLVLPMFVREGIDEPVAISSMPGVVHHSLSSLPRAVEEAAAAGVGGVMLFGVPLEKDAVGSGATDPEGILNVGTRVAVDAAQGALVVQTDLCLDEFTDHGHCGVLAADGSVDNDATLVRYDEMAVVQAEAGGLELGTLFVDEGFGSLDPDTLDAVMSELGRLSASGRVIGIVSHVDELKQRIADRIEVRRQPDGSSVLRTTVGS